MVLNLPKEAKPYERAILIVYSLGITDIGDISDTLGYPTKDSVYRVFRKYRDFIMNCRVMVAPKQRLIGRCYR